MSGNSGNATPRTDHAHYQGTFLVVVNHQEQYSIWPASRALPAGWRAEGTSGPRQACLDHIAEIWPDIRPLSLRQGAAGPSCAEGGTRA
jgi:MbtH protein